MFNSLALLSGKGGSGKSTLAVLIAEKLACNGKKVLLVDCDFGTHGMTYFFEEKLVDKDKYLSLIDIFGGEYKSKEILNVSENIDFMPSSVHFPVSLPIEGNNKCKFEEFLNWLKTLKYDIVIFDLQAGYSEIANIITSFSDKNLMVLEFDAVSASALRVLYSQLQKQLKKENTFQVYNKVSQVEHSLVLQMPKEILFRNLKPILFSWGIRQAAMLNIVFDMGNGENVKLREPKQGLFTKIKNRIFFKNEETVTDFSGGINELVGSLFP
ncbi:MAG: AAA family ATPase [Oscillospiraceae bacterium]|jgi:cellulose biosynthesis protein BcsQ|nr:AAA family ATPase [Oscillospiraceae bacterium]